MISYLGMKRFSLGNEAEQLLTKAYKGCHLGLQLRHVNNDVAV